MEIIDGNKISAEIKEELRKEISRLDKKPGLAAVLVGENPASEIYMKSKKRVCEEVGVYSEVFRFDSNTKEAKLLLKIDELNRDERFNGILVQLPLPKHIDKKKVIERIDPIKDVDGFHPLNRGLLLAGEPSFVPCTPLGIQELILRSGYEIEGEHVVIVGRSNIVGKPLANLLLLKNRKSNATVTVCHTGTRELEKITNTGDILVVASGRAKMIKGSMVKEGAIVIDVGVNRIEDKSRKSGYRLVGDVDFEGVKDKVKAISPVPGGVGPMTVTMLISNTLKAYKIQT